MIREVDRHRRRRLLALAGLSLAALGVILILFLGEKGGSGHVQVAEGSRASPPAEGQQGEAPPVEGGGGREPLLIEAEAAEAAGGVRVGFCFDPAAVRLVSDLISLASAEVYIDGVLANPPSGARCLEFPLSEDCELAARLDVFVPGAAPASFQIDEGALDRLVGLDGGEFVLLKLDRSGTLTVSVSWTDGTPAPDVSVFVAPVVLSGDHAGLKKASLRCWSDGDGWKWGHVTGPLGRVVLQSLPTNEALRVRAVGPGESVHGDVTLRAGEPALVELTLNREASLVVQFDGERPGSGQFGIWYRSEVDRITRFTSSAERMMQIEAVPLGPMRVYSKSGAFEAVDFTVEAGENLVGPIVFQPKVPIVGRVDSMAAIPLVGASVKFVVEGQSVAYAPVQSDGRFTLDVPNRSGEVVAFYETARSLGVLGFAAAPVSASMSEREVRIPASHGAISWRDESDRGLAVDSFGLRRTDGWRESLGDAGGRMAELQPALIDGAWIAAIPTGEFSVSVALTDGSELYPSPITVEEGRTTHLDSGVGSTVDVLLRQAIDGGAVPNVVCLVHPSIGMRAMPSKPAGDGDRQLLGVPNGALLFGGEGATRGALLGRVAGNSSGRAAVDVPSRGFLSVQIDGEPVGFRARCISGIEQGVFAQYQVFPADLVESLGALLPGRYMVLPNDPTGGERFGGEVEVVSGDVRVLECFSSSSEPVTISFGDVPRSEQIFGVLVKPVGTEGGWSRRGVHFKQSEVNDAEVEGPFSDGSYLVVLELAGERHHCLGASLASGVPRVSADFRRVRVDTSALDLGLGEAIEVRARSLSHEGRTSYLDRFLGVDVVGPRSAEFLWPPFAGQFDVWVTTELGVRVVGEFAVEAGDANATVEL